eukprot:CAMPEP_0113879000 /NCGR_PEP_ID=MMETSP0780_2-20120614/6991_1 /TAXON_ID=652834 /ORGANISM="Palpitomonas bilix" /LENGTH=475 /DNA_ID=CAMNT_0000865525 /DNA_START=21 /DNA_END=1448 /DNA_ORIENTATION=- /assembly_acc=CAM_ASM_000599
MAEKLETLVARLEAAVSKLELKSTGSADAAGEDEESPSVIAFGDFLDADVTTFFDAASKIGGAVKQQATQVFDAFRAQREFLVAVSKCKKPSAADFQVALKPTSDPMVAAQDMKDNRSEHKNHLALVSEGIGALGWVTMAPTPGPYVKEMLDAALFYGNKILVETKRAPEHVAYFNSFRDMLNNLASYIKDHHRTGIQWNASGIELKEFLASGGSKQAATSAAPAPVAGIPAPPPPPSVSMLQNVAPATGGANPGALFAELNKGGAITKGLKKVTDDMKAKNRADRSGVVSELPKKTPVSTASGKRAPAKPPRFEKEGNKWYIENQVDNETIEVDSDSMKNAAYIFGCSGKARRTVVQLKNKLNAVTVDSCSKTSVVIDEVIGSIEIVNCKSVEVQVSVAVPIITIDKCSACTLYLMSEKAMEAEIITSKNDSLNVITPGKSEDDDMVETPVPEQYCTKLVDGKWVTTPVEHASG